MGTPVVLRYLARPHSQKRFPEKRDCPRKPRMGGVAIFLAFAASVCATYLSFPQMRTLMLESSGYMAALAISSTAVFLLGIYDDLWGADAKKKLIVQVPAAVLLYFAGFKIGLITNPFAFLGGPESFIPPSYVSLSLTVLWLVGITNALNLIDGMDGLAAGVVFMASLTMMAASHFVGCGLVAFLFLAMAGAVLGFLPFNLPPAKITLGDSGSLFLGFTIAALSLQSSVKGAMGLAFLIPVTVLGLVILDTMWAVVRRNVQGKSLHTADLDHIHHRVERLMECPWKALLVLYST